MCGPDPASNFYVIFASGTGEQELISVCAIVLLLLVHFTDTCSAIADVILQISLRAVNDPVWRCRCQHSAR